MADPASLAALLGGDDLVAFEQRLRADNLLSQIAPAIGAVKFDRSTWSPGESFGTSLAQAFLSGAMGRIGSNQVGEQVGKVAEILPSLYADPLRAARPEGVDESAFNQLKAVSAVKQLQNRQLRAQKVEDLMYSLFGDRAKEMFSAEFAGEKAKNTKIGELQAFDAADGGTPAPTKTQAMVGMSADGQPIWAEIEEAAAPAARSDRLFKNPDDPRYKAQHDLFKIEQDYTERLLAGPQAQQAFGMNRAAMNIMEALQKDNPLAAATAIFEYAKLQDPAGTVREADEMRVADPGGPLGTLARTYNEIVQKGKLTPEAKQNMRELVPILQKNQFANYNLLKDNYLEAAKQYGADPSRIKYISPADLSPFLAEAAGAGVGGAGDIQAAALAELARRKAGAAGAGEMTKQFFQQ
jgi:hypothetical protein